MSFSDQAYLDMCKERDRYRDAYEALKAEHEHLLIEFANLIKIVKESTND